MRIYVLHKGKVFYCFLKGHHGCDVNKCLVVDVGVSDGRVVNEVYLTWTRTDFR